MRFWYRRAHQAIASTLTLFGLDRMSSDKLAEGFLLRALTRYRASLSQSPSKSPKEETIPWLKS
jgi:hypothetical protein